MTVKNNGILPAIVLAVLLLSGAAAVGCPSGKQALSPKLEEAQHLYQQGWAGSDAALKRAITFLEEFKSDGVGENLIFAYLGSAYVAAARMVPDREKPRMVLRGSRLLDRAVARDSENVEIRLVRLKTYVILPRLADKVDRIGEDGEWLLRAAQDRELSEDCRYEIWYRVASVRMRDRDLEAIGLFERALEIATTDVEKEQATRMLRLARAKFAPDSVH